MKPLYAPLQKILDAELAAGNEIDLVAENAWSEMDVVVYLKKPFHRSYLEEDAGDIEFAENHDPHYSLGENYSSRSHRQAIEAPFGK